MDDVTDPVCPNDECKKSWTQTFLCETLTGTFRLGPYKQHREKVLFDREKARLPDTQDDAKRYKDAVAIYEPTHTEMLRITRLVKSLPERAAVKTAEVVFQREWNAAFREERLKDTAANYATVCDATHRRPEIGVVRTTLSDAVKAYKDARRPHDTEARVLHDRLVPIRYAATHFGYEPPVVEGGAAAGAGAAAADAPRQRRAFIMKCPQSTCEGFLSSQYKCGLCDVHVCSHCHLVKTETHVCDPDLVETIKQIRKEAKPCPKCAALISKIDGCDQMWCTQCHTAFSWTTGAVAAGVVHNPHYFQYLRETGQTIPRADNPGFGCGAVNLLDFTLAYLCRTVPTALPLLEDYRRLNHIRHNDLISRRRILTGYQEQEWRRRLRVQRLVSEIDEAKWKDILQRHEKAFHKDTAWVQLLEMYTTVSLETMAELTRTSTAEDVARVAERLATIKTYTLQEAEKISKIYGCVIPEGMRPRPAVTPVVVPPVTA
jgi:hypothetical protein